MGTETRKRIKVKKRRFRKRKEKTRIVSHYKRGHRWYQNDNQYGEEAHRLEIFININRPYTFPFPAGSNKTQPFKITA